MHEGKVHIRRGRRTDFTAVMGLLAAAARPLPAPDRATLRRFRSLVADLGADFYLASVDGTLAGLVHVTYARQLAAAPAATLRQLVVAAPFQHRGVGTALLAFAQRRARQRGCAVLSCCVPADSAAGTFLSGAGLLPRGTSYVQELTADA